MAHTPRTYKYYDLILGAFVTTLLCANIIGASKVCTIGSFTFGAGVFFFPISYLFGDILTEVYGYAAARRVVWSGFAALLFASAMSAIIVAMPPAADWPHQAAYDVAFGSAPRITLASLVAFWMGEFTNSFTLAKMKIWTQGNHLFTRTIGSTVVGEFVDSLVFYPLAFAGNWPWELVVSVMFSNYLIKVLWEVAATPLTYRIVRHLKKAENEDYFDNKTDFNPFTLKRN